MRLESIFSATIAVLSQVVWIFPQIELWEHKLIITLSALFIASLVYSVGLTVRVQKMKTQKDNLDELRASKKKKLRLGKLDNLLNDLESCLFRYIRAKREHIDFPSENNNTLMLDAFKKVLSVEDEIHGLYWSGISTENEKVIWREWITERAKRHNKLLMEK